MFELKKLLLSVIVLLLICVLPAFAEEIPVEPECHIGSVIFAASPHEVYQGGNINYTFGRGDNAPIDRYHCTFQFDQQIENPMGFLGSQFCQLKSRNSYYCNDAETGFPSDFGHGKVSYDAPIGSTLVSTVSCFEIYDPVNGNDHECYGLCPVDQ